MSSSHVGTSPNAKDNMVAIKILDKCKIKQSEHGVRNLVQEIKVHWALEECDSILRLQEIYEDEVFVYLVLEY
jgi:Protein kinase domain